jgi:hypothetical protein
MHVQIEQALPDNMRVAPDATFNTEHEVPVTMPTGQHVWGRVTDMHGNDDGTALVIDVDIPDEVIPGASSTELSREWSISD